MNSGGTIGHDAMGKIRTLSFGEILWDIIAGEEHLGGAPFNLAAHAAKLGGSVSMLSRTGDDERGRLITARAGELGIDVSFLQNDPQHPTGTVDVTLSADGQPSYIIHENAAWDFIESPDDIVCELQNQSFDVLCFGTLAQRSPGSRAALLNIVASLKPRTVFYDVNLRQNFFTDEIIRESLAACTIAKLNDDEAATLSELLFHKEYDDDHFVEAVIRQFNIEVLCITRGGQGCSVYSEARQVHVASRPVDVVDTVGAGDAFGAAFLHKYCAGSDLKESAEFANRIAGFVASSRGAVPSSAYPV